MKNLLSFLLIITVISCNPKTKTYHISAGHFDGKTIGAYDGKVVIDENNIHFSGNGKEERLNIVNKRNENGYDIYQCIDKKGRMGEMKVDKKNKKLYITGEDKNGIMQTGTMDLY